MRREKTETGCRKDIGQSRKRVVAETKHGSEADLHNVDLGCVLAGAYLDSEWQGAPFSDACH